MQVIKKERFIYRFLQKKKYFTIHPEKELKQKNDNRDNTELTHLTLELWVLQSHHLQQKRD